LAKSVTPSRIEGNKTIVKLDSSDMEALENFSKENGVNRFVYPEFGVNFGFPDKDTGMVLA
jgi:glycerol 2-dehydrogenase (NADP+)